MADHPADGARDERAGRPELVAVEPPTDDPVPDEPAPDLAGPADEQPKEPAGAEDAATPSGRSAIDLATGASRRLSSVAANVARSRRWMVRDTPNTDRLRSDITQFTAELPGLVERAGGTGSLVWADTAEALAVGAAEALGRGDTLEAWSLLWAAEREAIDGLRPEEVRAAADATVDGAKALLEAHAVTATKKDLTGIESASVKTARGQLREARLFVDRLSLDVYRRLHPEARRISAFALLTVAFLVAGLGATLVGIPNGGDGDALSSAGRYLTVCTFGAAGAVLSLVLPWREQRPRPALLEFVNPVDLMVLRIAMGAAVALIFVALLQAGVQEVVQVFGTQAYPWALAAGFSERLLDRRMASLDAEARDLDSH